MRVGAVKILVSNCDTGIYLRWWFNGWHYYNFTNGYEIKMITENMDIQVTNMFSVISKIERPTRIKSKFAYDVTVEGIRPGDIGGFLGLLMAEQVMQYEDGAWREVEVARGTHMIREAGEPGFIFNFEVTREDLVCQSSVLKKSQKLYLNSVLCDLDDNEPIPINKQVNDISEMQDRQSDFTAQFSIRKTRLMKDLLELSGEVGIITTFPYEKQLCKLIHDGIELITNGNLILDRVTEQYYLVAVYSGNINFFNLIDGSKITDLLLPTTDHTWNEHKMNDSQVGDLDYCYPLLEPSNDGGMCPAPPATPTYVQLYGGWIWPFIKVKAIWDEIFATAGYTAQGDILTDYTFTHLFMPISNCDASYIDLSQYLYSLSANNKKVMSSGTNLLDLVSAEVSVTVGDAIFAYNGMIKIKVAGTYTFRVEVWTYGMAYVVPVYVYLYKGAAQVAVSTGDVRTAFTLYHRTYTFEYACIVNDVMSFRCSTTGLSRYDLQVLKIVDPTIAYGSTITPHRHLPDLTQTDFVKMICNLFGLVPEADAKNKKIRFWNYQELYDNVPIARDWSAYLSEREDEVEFKFGDYARRNYLRYKESEDVIKDTGMGVLEVADENLPLEKDIVEVDVSTCDEVLIYDETIPVSRINFNTWSDTGVYEKNRSIDPRIVLIDRLPVSPPSTLEFEIRNVVAAVAVGASAYTIVDAKLATSLGVAFSSLSPYYAALKRILNQTNLRRAKFNLPAYEVAGFRHNIPIYISQYKAYFYVNKIENYVPGMLCTIEMIKL